MGKFRKLFGRGGREGAREDFDNLLRRAAKPKHEHHRRVETESEAKEFAEALVRDYGETLVMLGKE